MFHCSSGSTWESCLENKGTIPLLSHPLSSCIKVKTIYNSYNFLTRDPTTAAIFSIKPVVAFWWERTLRDILEHTSDLCQTEIPQSLTCSYLLCRFHHLNMSGIHTYVPKSSSIICEHSTCCSEKIVLQLVSSMSSLINPMDSGSLLWVSVEHSSNGSLLLFTNWYFFCSYYYYYFFLLLHLVLGVKCRYTEIRITQSRKKNFLISGIFKTLLLVLCRFYGSWSGYLYGVFWSSHWMVYFDPAIGWCILIQPLLL